MPTYVPPKRATAFTFYVSLVQQASPKLFQVNPTLAAGDVKVSTDGGAEANIATLPVVTPAGSRRVKVDLSAGEMTGDNVQVTFSDTAGAEWCDLTVNIHTSTRQVDDLAYPATSGRSLAVEADGMVYADLREWLGEVTPLYSASVMMVGHPWATIAQEYAAAFHKGGMVLTSGVTNVQLTVYDATTGATLFGPTAMSEYSGTGVWHLNKTTDLQLYYQPYMAKVTATIDSATRTCLAPCNSSGAWEDVIYALSTRLPGSLVGGRMDSSVGAMASGVLTDAAIAAPVHSRRAIVRVMRLTPTVDRYLITYLYKNAVSAVTSPSLYVIRADDGVDIISGVTPTQVSGWSGQYYYDSSTLLQEGEAYLAYVDGNIGGEYVGHVEPLVHGGNAQLDMWLAVSAIKVKTDNLPSGVKRNTALAQFSFLMVDSADHVTPKTGLTVTAQRSLDGAAFGACANSPTELSNGIYLIDLAAGDLDGAVVTFRFTATGADARLLTVLTEP